MSSGGRLPSLNDGTLSKSSGAPKPALKFKPKAVARKSKEERDASVAKIADVSKSKENKKKQFQNKKIDPKAKGKVPRYLENTHVISSGPLAAGNFADMKEEARGFTKVTPSGLSHSICSLSRSVKQDPNSSDESDVDMDNGEAVSNTKILKINLGKEFDLEDMNNMHDEADEVEEENDQEVKSDSNEHDKEITKKIQRLFPVRPVRIAHEDIDNVQREIQNYASAPVSHNEITSSYETKIKLENEDSKPIVNENPTDLKKYIMKRQELLDKKIEQLEINEVQSSDLVESSKETLLLEDDYRYLAKKLGTLDNHPSKYMLFQLPSKLPKFKDLLEKRVINENKPDKFDNKNANGKKPLVPVPVTPKATEDKLPTGNIGSLRIHKSGKISMKIGNVVMNVHRGAESTFLQDLIMVNKDDEEPNVNVIGSIDTRIVVTPKL
ncbi:hypothetical protein TPHA_0J01700 [Tetrapisispora phaffii CBS 4417]|uniref:DNA-directed RNA polymerase III subunit RPC4 n=1 Tax=Tetrapisispora phaffii (strain ATCC 24235 / CBS 4417 / NBRC 1672 / NRRL Y-8282 / UCD 70-5) TaxID=1071381 RepID=G8BYP9_TETPH|nr:hypothetical protein TPHA_0J01700 [Tetrapisispora phaffii CBS 4417]CCE64991.1 hypothetical protein TPHA_0J01700 [Tetrapisispora phaffii CBS 4417]